MRAVSKERQRENVIRRQTMIEVRVRDGHQCVGSKINPITCLPYLPEPCFGPLNGHEIITRGDGGSITDAANIVLLCDFHNGWCTEHDDEAQARGFREKRWSPYSPNVASRLPHSVIAVMEEGAQRSLDFILNECVPLRAVPDNGKPLPPSNSPVRLAEVHDIGSTRQHGPTRGAVERQPADAVDPNKSKRPAPPAKKNADLSDEREISDEHG